MVSKKMDMDKKVTEAELEIMKILWAKDEPVSSADIRRILKEQKKWEKSTVLTLMRRLADKNIITADKKTSSYLPNISESDYIVRQTQDMVDKLFGGSVKNLIAALCESKLTQKEVEELRKYFMEEVK
jgi:BlaI family transcriptional regulator, penicillinase repressor